jgi:hypothetical protein
MRWDDPQEVRSRVQPLFEGKDTLPLILEKHLRFGTRHVEGDRSATRIPLLNSKHMEQVVDIAALEIRVRSMLSRSDLTPSQRAAGEQYVRAMESIHAGGNPDFMRADERRTETCQLGSAAACTYCLISDRRSAVLNWEGVVPSHVRKAR